MNIQRKLAHSSNYTFGRTKPIQYIVIHYTANNGDTAKGNCNYFATGGRNASAHYFVDENSVYQSVSDDNTAWSVGAKNYAHPYCRNHNSISIEMCSRKDNNGAYYIKDEVVANTVGLTKELMKKYNIPIDNVLTHNLVTGKRCPEPFVRNPDLWSAFKKRLEGDDEVVEISKMIVNGKEISVDRILKNGTNYIKIRDIADALGYNISSQGNIPVLTK